MLQCCAFLKAGRTHFGRCAVELSFSFVELSVVINIIILLHVFLFLIRLQKHASLTDCIGKNSQHHDNTDSHTGRAVHSGKSWMETPTRCRLFHGKGCLSALQDASERAEVPIGALRLQHFCVFSHQCETVQY
ncbi:hypothetical protein FQA47_002313 [Oryzias melastigma]|uniref:Uncharacterized protein n=1 Tax=Oryzias melastigma TaxID=30732 RepID=A0A834C417_ORYME|nr:hypothetical protein FQA47_002313 [Oryzias melastigma]